MNAAQAIGTINASDAKPQGLARPSTAPEFILLRAILIGIAPVFALLTWQTEYSFTQMRHFSVPVMIGEFAIILLAFCTRFDAGRAIAALHPVTQITAVLWLAVSAWASLVVAQPGQGANLLFLTSCLHALFGLTVWWKLQTDWQGRAGELLSALALGLALYAAIILALALGQANNPTFDWVHFSPGVSHDRQLAFYGLTLSGLAAGFAGGSKNARCGIIWASFLVVGCWLTIWSGGRAGFGAMIGALTLTGMLIPAGRRLRYFAIATVSVTAAIILSYGFIPHERYGFNSILYRTAASDGGVGDFSTGRLRMWGETLGYIMNHPLFGHGEGQFRSIVESSTGRYNHPHNSPLQMVFQWGIVGTLALMAMLSGTARKAVRNWRNLPRRAVVATGPLAGLAAMSLLEGSAYHAMPVMMMVLCFAVIAASPPNESRAI